MNKLVLAYQYQYQVYRFSACIALETTLPRKSLSIALTNSAANWMGTFSSTMEASSLPFQFCMNFIMNGPHPCLKIRHVQPNPHLHELEVWGTSTDLTTYSLRSNNFWYMKATITAKPLFKLSINSTSTWQWLGIGLRRKMHSTDVSMLYKYQWSSVHTGNKNILHHAKSINVKSLWKSHPHASKTSHLAAWTTKGCFELFSQWMDIQQIFHSCLYPRWSSAVLQTFQPHR